LAVGLGDPARRAALLVALGEAQHHAGETGHRRTLAEAAGLALELGDAALAARAALANQRPVSLMLRPDPERVVLLERVLEALGPDDSAARARVLIAIATELHHSTDPRRHELAREAVTVARRLGDAGCLGRVLGLAAFALWEPDTLAERLEIATELSDLAGRLHDPILSVDAGLALFYAAAHHGDVERARQALATATRAAGEIGRPALRRRALVAQQSCAMLEGRQTEFNRLAAEVLEIGEALGIPDRLISYHGDGGIHCLLHGRIDEAITNISSVLDMLPPPYRAFFLAWPYAEAGRCDEAAELIAGIGGASLRDVPKNYVRLFILTFLAPACAVLGDRELARRLYDELLPYRTQIVVGQVSTIGPVAHYLGLLAAVLGRPDEAEELFSEACAFAERTGARGILARTRLELARLLARRARPGDAERAGVLAAAAQELALELGAPALAERAHAALAAETRRA
jgi:tetratricopeptide (TPR) repeat protein